MVLVVFTYLIVPFPIIYDGKLTVFLHCFVQLAMSYFFGIIAALIAELPALNLEKLVFSNDRRGQPVCLKNDEIQLKAAVKLKTHFMTVKTLESL